MMKRESLIQAGSKSSSRQTKVWVRLPNWLGDVMMALPFIRSLQSHKDLEITLVSQKQFIPLLRDLKIGDKLIPLPEKGLGYFFNLIELRKKRPDKYFLLTNSERADFESYIIGAPQRYGIQTSSRLKRFFLNHRWHQPASFDENKNHQTYLWELYLDYFSLKGEVSYKPFYIPTKRNARQKVIGFIAGTENTPQKRWPIKQWRKLLSLILKENNAIKVNLFGTPKDKDITDQILEGFDSTVVNNLAGKTDLLQFSNELKKCDVVICNDTGGMHLANALGVPVIAIFGPTNPIRTGPIYEAPTIILQPKGRGQTDKTNIANISPEEVYKALKDMHKS